MNVWALVLVALLSIAPATPQRVWRGPEGRGAVSGRVIDEGGAPIAGMTIYVIPVLNGRATSPIVSSAPTDDRGRFRIDRLSAGNYLVATETRRDAFAQPDPYAGTAGDRVARVRTFFPSTADEDQAERVAVREDKETTGVEIRIVSGRVYTIAGIATDSQGVPIARAIGSLVKTSAIGRDAAGFSTDAHGRFRIRDLTPGEYRLALHEQVERIVNGSVVSGGPGEFASVPVMVDTYREDLVIVTGPGATISGRIVFEPGPPPSASNARATRMSVVAAPGDPRDRGLPTPEPASVSEDLTFTMKRLFGKQVLRPRAGPAHAVKSIMVGGVDITDMPHEFKSGDRVTIVLARRASWLEGRVTDAMGQPASGSRLIAFPEDKRSWRVDSVRTVYSVTRPDGDYRIGPLTAGRYYVAAVPADRLKGRPPDTALFEELAKEASSLVIGEEERRQMDLKVLGGGGLP